MPALRVMVGKQGGRGHADLGAGAVQLGLGGENVGPAAHQFRGEGDRQFTREIYIHES